MSDDPLPSKKSSDNGEYLSPDPDSGPSGPNLKVLYAALAVALIAAIGLALLIVLPFYRHR